MADLQVDADALSAAASKGDAVAAGLSTGSETSALGSQPSEAGVSAFDAALSAVQTHQSTRVSENTSALHASATVYTTTDGDGANGISRAI